MALSSSDLVLYESSLGAAPDDETSTVGGSITALTVDNVLDEIFQTITANEAGGATKTRYAKMFYANNNAGSALYGAGSDTGPRIYIDTAEPLNHTWYLGSGTSTDTTTQGTVPGGVSFVPQDGTSNFALILGSELGAGSSVGIWVQVDVAAGTTPGEVQSDITISGVTGSG